MKITIYGAGYVGLVTGACFAELGNHVLCMDVDKTRIAKLNQGVCPIHEPDLPGILSKNIKSGHLRFTDNAEEAVSHGFYQFIAVGTPQDEDGSADLKYVLSVAENIGKYLNDYRMVITKSTVPVGTAEKVRQTIEAELKKRKKNITFDMASNPEFLREGAAIQDFMNSDRIIIGIDNRVAEEHLEQLYAPFDRNHNRIIAMDIKSAELTKYAANAMLATKISFVNELSQLAEHLGADIEKIRIGIGSDPRIGYSFIQPGCGYGGSCFPKDIRALEVMAKNVDYPMSLIRAVDSANHAQKQVLFKKIQHHYNNTLSGKTFALWGLAFKPNTDDMREASSRVLMEQLWNAGANVQAYDPAARDEAERIYKGHKNLTLCDSPEAVLKNADALIVVTEWRHFASPDFELIKNTLKEPVVFDGRNLYDPDYLAKMGFDYYAIGRGKNIYGVS